MTNLETDVRNMMTDIRVLERKQERLSNIVEGLHGENGLQDVVREIAVTMASMERMLKFVTYLAVPLAVLSLFISFGAVIVAVVALKTIP